MKRFCSTCGNQLELNQKVCTQCGAANPYYNKSFSFLSDQSDALEKLRFEKERIEKELKEKEEAQREFEEQERHRLEKEEREKQKKDRSRQEQIERERIEAELKQKLLAEQAERERMEAGLKKELDRVKQETEQYKQQTTDLVKEVRDELLQMEEENIRLKQEVETLSAGAPPAKPDEPVSIRTFMRSRGLVLLLVVLLAMVSALVYLFLDIMQDKSANSNPPAKPESKISANQNGAVVDSAKTDTVKQFAEATVMAKDTAIPPKPEPVHEKPKSIAVAKTDTIIKAKSKPAQTPAAQTKPLSTEKKVPSTAPAKADTTIKTKPKTLAVQSPAATPKPMQEAIVPSKIKTSFVLTTAKVKSDLVGKKISGCGVVVSSLSEVESISNVVLVEKLSSGTLKYKFSSTIVQGSDKYSASPYIYYSADGNFLKLDGTNCE